MRGSGQTAPAATVVLATFTVPTGHSVSIRCDAVARILGGANDGLTTRARRDVVARDIGGVLTVEAQNAIARLGNPALILVDIAHVAVGNTLELRATGIAVETIDWMSWQDMIVFEP